MDGLIVTVFLVLVAGPVGIILLWAGQSNLRRRVADLEQRIAALQAVPGAATFEQAAPVQTAPPVQVTAVQVTAEPAAIMPPPYEPAAPTPANPWDSATLASVIPKPAANPQNQPIVLAPARVTALATWLRQNWVYAVSALSLALAGVFFVQYGVEKGLLPPAMRVTLAVLFGLGLIGAGEWVRRRWGDDLAAHTAYLPSVFSGAGLVSVFAGLVAGRLMYGLYGAGPTFAGLVLTAALAVGLGWRHGPLLVAIGLLGAAAAPFLVAGPGDAAPWLYAHYALIAATGLAVDAWRRWAWVSVLALVLGFGGGALMQLGGAGISGWMASLLVLVLLALSVPQRRLIPDHPGPSISEWLWQSRAGKGGDWPGFPTRLAAGAVLTATLAAALLAAPNPASALLALGTLALLTLILLLWADRAPGLADLATIPATGFLGRLMLDANGPLGRDYASQAADLRNIVDSAPGTASLLLGMAALISGAFALRARQSAAPHAGALSIAHGLDAALAAPIAAVILELLWHPADVIGAYAWALHSIALAAAMTGLAVMFARLDGESDRRRAAYATLSALSLVALTLFLITTQSALTLALAVLAVIAAGLDRRFRLPEMTLFIQIACAVLGWRLIADPGVDWAVTTALPNLLITYGGTVAALLAAHRILPAARLMAKGVLESAAAGLAAILANILIFRWLEADAADASANRYDLGSHWGVALQAMPWLILMLVQLYRLPLGGPFTRLRQAIALLAAALAAFGMALACTIFNPLTQSWEQDLSGHVRGPMILDTLAVAYALPGLALLLAARRMVLPRRIAGLFTACGAGLMALYTGLEIRRFWQGDWLGGATVSQPELYSYTVALMILGAVLLYQSIAARAPVLRKIAMAVIGLTIAKVFLLDAAGLTGLTRVFSFLGLGLSLAGLAWLNRWAETASEQRRDG